MENLTEVFKKAQAAGHRMDMPALRAAGAVTLADMPAPRSWCGYIDGHACSTFCWRGLIDKGMTCKLSRCPCASTARG